MSVADSLPFSDACERNKRFIVAVLEQYLPDNADVLEIGSGTGQHAIWFAQQMPQMNWQPTDTGAGLPGLFARLRAEAPANVQPAIELDVRMDPWPVGSYHAIFSANTLHFMSASCVEAFFAGAAHALLPGGRLVVYGPFRYAGGYTAASNAHFDDWLKASDPERGVRDFEWVNQLARQQGLQLLADVPMPANNQTLVWSMPALT